MVRFPSILKSRVLWRTWPAQFFSTSSQGITEKKQGEEVKISSEDSQDDKVNTEGEEVRKVSLQKASQDDKVNTEGEEVSKMSSQEASQDEEVNTEGEEVSQTSLQEASQDDKGKMQGVEVNSPLPEELVERILAMVPFPYIFNVRALSKSWLARFSPITSQDDEVKKQLAISFQKKVGELSTKWKTFCPIFMDLSNGFLGYDRASHKWQRMPLLSFLPGFILRAHQQYPRTFILRAHQQIDGALMLLSGFHPPRRETERMEHKRHLANFLTCSWKEVRPLPNVYLCAHRRRVEHKLYVANFLTRTWKELPCPPQVDGRSISLLFKNLVSQTLLGTYKVIMFYCVFDSMQCYGGPGSYLAQIYDSKSNAWRTEILVKEGLKYRCHPAYLSGVVYMPVGTNPRDLLALNVDEGTFEELEIVGNIMGRVVEGLVVCNNNLLMIVRDSCYSKPVQVLKIDLKLLTFLEVARGPPLALGVDMKNTPYGVDGDCICFPTKWHLGMVVYNVLEDEWSHIPFPATHNYSVSIDQTSFSFQPNLNPFLAV